MAEPNLSEDTIICECCGKTASPNDPTWEYGNALAGKFGESLEWDILVCADCCGRAANENGEAVSAFPDIKVIATVLYDFLWEKIQSAEWWGKKSVS